MILLIRVGLPLEEGDGNDGITPFLKCLHLPFVMPGGNRPLLGRVYPIVMEPVVLHNSLIIEKEVYFHAIDEHIGLKFILEICQKLPNFLLSRRYSVVAGSILFFCVRSGEVGEYYMISDFAIDVAHFAELY